MDPKEHVEADYGDRVCKLWLSIRELPVLDVREMVGQNGTSSLVHALLQWRQVERKTPDWRRVVSDVCRGLRCVVVAEEDSYDCTVAELLTKQNKPQARNCRRLLEERASSVVGRSNWVPPARTQGKFKTKSTSAGPSTSARQKRARDDSGSPARERVGGRPRKEMRFDDRF